jgi:hypothetical protein
MEIAPGARWYRDRQFEIFGTRQLLLTESASPEFAGHCLPSFGNGDGRIRVD